VRAARRDGGGTAGPDEVEGRAAVAPPAPVDTLRFRWFLGVGAVTAPVGDVVVVLGVFAWSGRQVDGVFVAALLTVIGYTVDAPVVVSDRVREVRAGSPRAPFARLTGAAVLATLPRTVNTGLSTTVVLAALLALGGAGLADPALALLVGIVAGTASTIAVAAPSAIALQQRWGRPSKPAPAGRRRDRSAGGAVL
jgi:SecD/SecF fusion protein